jgi:glycosyl transferase, family 25
MGRWPGAGDWTDGHCSMGSLMGSLKILGASGKPDFITYFPVGHRQNGAVAALFISLSGVEIKVKFIDFFERTYVINLPERSDRRQGIAKELARAGLPFTSGKVELFPAIRPQDQGLFEGIGMRGCFLSHLYILKKAKADGLRNVLIVEDDLAIHPDFIQYEAALLSELQQMDWDIVTFGYLGDDKSGIKSKINSNSTPEHSPILQSFEGETIGTHFYAVNGKTLDLLIQFFETLMERPLNHPEGGAMSPDGALNVFKWQHPQSNRLIAVPSLGDQRSSRSDISPGWFDNVPILKNLAEVARSVLRK